MVAITTAVAVSQSFGRFTYSLLFTDIRDDFALSNTVAGALGSLNLLAYVLGSVLVSTTVVSIGMGRTVRFGLFGVVLSLGLLAWSPTIALVTITMVIAGVAAAGVWVTAPGIATEVLGAARRGVAAGWITGGVGLGLVLASIINALTSEGRWRIVYLVELLIGVVAVIALALTTRHLGKHTPTAKPQKQSRLRHAFDVLKSVPAWRLTVAAYGLFAAVISLVLTFTIARLTEDAELSSTTAAIAFALIGVGSVIGGPLLGAIADRLGSRRTIALGLVIAAVGITAIATGNAIAALAGTFTFGIAFTGIVAGVAAYFSGHLDGEAFGAAYGLVTIVFGAGLAIGPQVGGLAADLFDSFLPAFVLAIGACVLGLVLNGWGDDPQSAPATANLPTPTQPTIAE